MSLKNLIYLSVTLTILFASSCKKQEQNDYEKAAKVFTDFDPMLLEKNSKLSKDEMWFKNLTIYRLQKNVEWEGGSYKLNISSGKEINVSERLFNYYSLQLDATNQLIKMGLVQYRSGKLIQKFGEQRVLDTQSNDNEDPNRDPCGNAIADADWGLFDGFDITLPDEAVSLIETYGTTAEAVGFISTLGETIGPIVTGIIAVGIANISHTYNQTGNGNGVTLHFSNTTILGAAAGGIGVGMATGPGLGTVTAGGIAVGFMEVTSNEAAHGGPGC